MLRPHYAHIVEHGARLGHALGHPQVTVAEFGVAGGRGLLALEALADRIGRRGGVDIRVVGFDLGTGLPEPEDYRDLPYHWKSGFYAMDEDRLRAMLHEAEIRIGDLSETIPQFVDDAEAPVAAVSIDVDYFSSTVKALELFRAAPERLLPRVLMYFDDVVGGPIELYGEFAGELAAIGEFNETSEVRKIHRVRYLDSRTLRREWHGQVFACHVFDHPDYATFVSDDAQNLPLGRLSRWVPHS